MSTTLSTSLSSSLRSSLPDGLGIAGANGVDCICPFTACVPKTCLIMKRESGMLRWTGVCVLRENVVSQSRYAAVVILAHSSMSCVTVAISCFSARV